MNTVSFPGLGIELNINPVAIEIFGWSIYWYGIIIAAGLLTAVLVAVWDGKRAKLPSNAIEDVALLCIPAAIIGARLYYVVFKWTDYASNPLSILYIWEGGLAIYGAIITAVATAYIYCRIKKISWRKVFDIGAIGLLIGQAVGRWGNFVNAEAYGSATNVPWRMEIREAGRMIAVHPTFLYESLWNFIGLIGLLLYRRNKKFDGEIFILYITWYGLGRVWIEQLRADSLLIFGQKVSLLVAAMCVIIGVAFYFIEIKKKEKEKL